MVTTTTPWSDTPPSEAGWWWLRKRRTGQCVARYRDEDANWPVGHLGSDDQRMREYFQFGPRVLSAEETVALTAEVERLKRENAELRETLTVDDLDQLERYRSPLGAGLGLDGKPIG